MSVYPGIAAHDYEYRLQLDSGHSLTEEGYQAAAASGLVTWGRPFSRDPGRKHGILISILGYRYPFSILTYAVMELEIPHLGVHQVVSFPPGWASSLNIRLKITGRALTAGACNAWQHDCTDILWYVDDVLQWQLGGADSMAGDQYRPSLNRYRARPAPVNNPVLLPLGFPTCDDVPLLNRVDQQIKASWWHYPPPGYTIQYETIDIDSAATIPAPGGVCGCTDSLLDFYSPSGDTSDCRIQSMEKLRRYREFIQERTCLCGDGINGTTYAEYRNWYDQQSNQSGGTTDPEQVEGTWLDLIPANWGLNTSTKTTGVLCVADPGPIPAYTTTETTAAFAGTKAPFRRSIARETGDRLCGELIRSTPCTNLIGGEIEDPPPYCGPDSKHACYYAGYVGRQCVDVCENYDLHLTWQNTRPMWIAASGASGIKLREFAFRGLERDRNVIAATDVRRAQIAVLSHGYIGIVYEQGALNSAAIKFIESRNGGDSWGTPQTITPVVVTGEWPVIAADEKTGVITVGFRKRTATAGWDFYNRRRDSASWAFLSHFDEANGGRGALEWANDPDRLLVFVYESGGTVYARESLKNASSWRAATAIAAGSRPAMAIWPDGKTRLALIDSGAGLKIYRQTTRGGVYTDLGAAASSTSQAAGIDYSCDGPKRAVIVCDDGTGLRRYVSRDTGATWAADAFHDPGL